MTHEQRLRKAEKARAALARKAIKSKYRQRYHFMPPAGWINDPNGCIWFGGRYHIFYQHNPYGGVWSAMHWGHATSADLMHWEHQPIALAPSESYDDHPDGGVFSGSAVDNGGKMDVLYTATTNYGSGFVQAQCLAKSKDGGMTFTKFSGNPVIKNPPAGTSPDFRDPRALRYKDSWYMILGASLGSGAWHEGEGCAHMYKSQNLEQWDYCGIIARSHGQYGTMWECPDLFPLGDKWALTFCPMFCEGHRSMYMVGDMDFENAVFTPEQVGDLDFGGEYYASQSLRTPDGRTVLIAWQNGWDWMPGWKDFGPTAPDGWCGCLALPRQVDLDRSNRLVFAPVKEVELQRVESEELQDVRVDKDALVVPVADAVCFELEIVLDLTRTDASELLITLRAGGTYHTDIIVDLKNRTLLFDRNNSDAHSEGSYSCAIAPLGEEWALRIYSDTSSIELFCDDGRTCMSNTVYPTHAEQQIYITARNGQARMKKLATWGIKQCNGEDAIDT